MIIKRNLYNESVSCSPKEPVLLSLNEAEEVKDHKYDYLLARNCARTNIVDANKCADTISACNNELDLGLKLNRKEVVYGRSLLLAEQRKRSDLDSSNVCSRSNGISGVNSCNEIGVIGNTTKCNTYGDKNKADLYKQISKRANFVERNVYINNLDNAALNIKKSIIFNSILFKIKGELREIENSMYLRRHNVIAKSIDKINKRQDSNVNFEPKVLFCSCIGISPERGVEKGEKRIKLFREGFEKKNARILLDEIKQSEDILRNYILSLKNERIKKLSINFGNENKSRIIIDLQKNLILSGKDLNKVRVSIKRDNLYNLQKVLNNIKEVRKGTDEIDINIRDENLSLPGVRSMPFLMEKSKNDGNFSGKLKIFNMKCDISKVITKNQSSVVSNIGFKEELYKQELNLPKKGVKMVISKDKDSHLVVQKNGNNDVGDEAKKTIFNKTKAENKIPMKTNISKLADSCVKAKPNLVSKSFLNLKKVQIKEDKSIESNFSVINKEEENIKTESFVLETTKVPIEPKINGKNIYASSPLLKKSICTRNVIDLKANSNTFSPVKNVNMGLILSKAEISANSTGTNNKMTENNSLDGNNVSNSNDNNDSNINNNNNNSSNNDNNSNDGNNNIGNDDITNNKVSKTNIYKSSQDESNKSCIADLKAMYNKSSYEKMEYCLYKVANTERTNSSKGFIGKDNRSMRLLGKKKNVFNCKSRILFNDSYKGRRYVNIKLGSFTVKRYGLNSFKRCGFRGINEVLVDSDNQQYLRNKLFKHYDGKNHIEYAMEDSISYVYGINKHRLLLSITCNTLNEDINLFKLSKLNKYALSSKMNHLEDFVEEVMGEMILNGDLDRKEHNDFLEEKIMRLRYLINTERDYKQNIRVIKNKKQIEEANYLWEKLISMYEESSNVKCNLDNKILYKGDEKSNNNLWNHVSKFVFEEEVDFFKDVYYCKNENSNICFNEGQNDTKNTFSSIRVPCNSPLYKEPTILFFEYNNKTLNKKYINYIGKLSPWTKMSLFQNKYYNNKEYIKK
ncbi:hypothetical protein FG379_002258 [Cryptosporidium bovis]|uniref:uncharacterized protein n=1 Tax=Cryptosporidium bovis TaxID=310047 RepID=UPI003519E42C|nr:hypothetical protein FG379_002258 [Cryptosporidium bovis]